MGIGPWKKAIFHGLTSWSIGVNWPLTYVYHSIILSAQLRPKHIRPTYLSEDTSEFEVAPSKASF